MNVYIRSLFKHYILTNGNIATDYYANGMSYNISQPKKKRYIIDILRYIIQN